MFLTWVEMNEWYVANNGTIAPIELRLDFNSSAERQMLAMCLSGKWKVHWLKGEDLDYVKGHKTDTNRLNMIADKGTNVIRDRLWVPVQKFFN